MQPKKIRPYNKNIKLAIYDEMQKHYDIMLDEKLDMHIPRIWYDKRVMFKDIVYYIDILYENNPGKVADIGAGANIWVDWFPNIIAFEPDARNHYTNLPDYTTKFDYNFVTQHINNFDCALAINSLHYTSFDKVKNTIKLALNIVEDRFLFTFNLRMLCKRSNIEYDYQMALYKLLILLPKDNIVMLDWTDDEEIGPINGHVRIIYETG